MTHNFEWVTEKCLTQFKLGSLGEKQRHHSLHTGTYSTNPIWENSMPRTRIPTAFTLSPEAHADLKALAASRGVYQSRVVEDLIRAERRRVYGEHWDTVVRVAKERPRATAEGIARAEGIDQSVIEEILLQAGLDTQEKRLAASGLGGGPNSAAEVHVNSWRTNG